MGGDKTGARSWKRSIRLIGRTTCKKIDILEGDWQ